MCSSTGQHSVIFRPKLSLLCSTVKEGMLAVIAVCWRFLLPGSEIKICLAEIEVFPSSIFSSALLSNPAGIAAQIENGINRLRRLPPYYECLMGIASTASDGIQSRLDELRQKELESQDRKGLSRGSNRQFPSRTIHRIARPTRGLLPRPRVLLR